MRFVLGPAGRHRRESDVLLPRSWQSNHAVLRRQEDDRWARLYSSAKGKRKSLTSEQIERELAQLSKVFGELSERVTRLQKRVWMKAEHEEESEIMESGE